jgi:hypothetical protein
MRTAVVANTRRQQVSVGRSIPAPVGGWDAQNPLADMPPENAPLMRNWIPRTGYVEMRRGYVEHVLLPSVESLIVYRGGSPDAIFACAGSDIIDVTASGSAGSTVYGSAVNARWQYVNFSNDAGAFAIAVNGANTPQGYNGTAFSDLTITGSSGPITLTSSTLIDVMAHKRRLYFIETSSLRVWFLAVSAIQGAAQLLDLGPIFTKGGSLLCQGTWTMDGGAGPDDMAVFITDQGEVAVYQGDDPADVENWALIGVYSIGVPIGRRAIMKWGADLAVVTTDGVVPLSQALYKDRAEDDNIALTAKIQPAFSDAILSYGSNFGWQGLLYPKGSLAIFNIPLSGVVSEQYVQNIQTGAWCRFTGINAICWAVADDAPYFADSNGVYLWDVGPTDNGIDLTGDVQCAFNYFGQRGVQKQFTMLRPIIQANRTVMPAVEMLVDYGTGVPTATPTTVLSENAIWDVSLWETAIWEQGIATRYSWTSVTGIGYCGSPIMRVSLSSGGDNDITVRLIGFDVLFQRGGQL